MVVFPQLFSFNKFFSSGVLPLAFNLFQTKNSQAPKFHPHFSPLATAWFSCLMLFAPAQAQEAGEEQIDVAAPKPAIAGVLRSRTDIPVAGADIYVKSSASASSILLKTDGRGRFQVFDLPLGDVTIVARDPVTQALSMTQTQLQRAEQDVRLDLQVARADARVEGVVMHNGKPVADASVSLLSRRVFSDFGLAQRMTTTDANGRFVIERVMPGAMRLVVEQNGQVGQGDLLAKSGATAQVQLSLGNSVMLPGSLRGDDGSSVDIDWNLALINGGMSQGPYQNAYALQVNGIPFPGMSAASVHGGGRELRLEAVNFDGVDVSRQIYMPQGGAYVRYLEMLHNTSEHEKTVRLDISGVLGAAERSTVLISPEEGNGHFALTGDQNQNMRLGHVFGGGNAPLSGSAQFDSGGSFSYQWSLTLAPGARMAVMHFALQNGAGNIEYLHALAQALVNLRQPDMMLGLGGVERAVIKNFLIRQ